MADFLRSPPSLVAIASKDGVLIDECFGRAGQYYIYEAGAEGYRFKETRPSPVPCQEQRHDAAMMARTAELLADCDLVLAGRIGPQALRQLEEKGILGLAVHMEIKGALERLRR
jgi:predicted Fe-Mo cluster-binding NifX family protein